ncbi:serine protease family S33 [Thraustotheca clavata]|uniref:Serine protease family S33 n=1 Tax=Thraustotheca clavata TaxID=74557 RepID=A0A1V9Z004_9STRA|nr:serine protease family S33 [Thraustotheca clavata]
MESKCSMRTVSFKVIRCAADVFLNSRRSRLGYAKNQVEAGGYQWSFLEKHATTQDTPEHVVLFVHGFSSEKDSWLNVASRALPSSRVLIPDLPGHGMTMPQSNAAEYGALAQVERLKAFVDATVPKNVPIHLVGCSMGGLISGLYAATYPDQLQSLTLICPAGISMPKRSPVLAKYEDEGVNLMRAGNIEEFQTLMQYISYRPPGYVVQKPQGMQKVMLSLLTSYRAEKMPIIDKILNDMMANQRILEDNLHKIRVPTVVLWGQEDQILDVSCIERMEGKLDNAHIVVLPKCGHVVQHTYPEVCAAYINQMISETTPALAFA